MGYDCAGHFKLKLSPKLARAIFNSLSILTRGATEPIGSKIKCILVNELFSKICVKYAPNLCQNVGTAATIINVMLGNENNLQFMTTTYNVWPFFFVITKKRNKILSTCALALDRTAPDKEEQIQRHSRFRVSVICPVHWFWVWRYQRVLRNICKIFFSKTKKLCK